MKYLFTILFISFCQFALAQDPNATVNKGNDSYRKGDYKNAIELYKTALAADAKNKAATFNMGNAYSRLNNNADAEKLFDDAAISTDNNIKAKALYNKGVVQVAQQKLQDAIGSFKQSLLIDPTDEEARENLQKALIDLRKQQQSAPPPPANNKKQQQKNKPLNKDLIEQKLNELRDKEKQLQKRLQQKTNRQQPEKDW
jgi:Ca-activated chloride channel homolog